jgi:pimeloyl-ACP methyl ester carboxylesterase
MPLALDAAYNMKKRYNIDTKRVYIAGHSGGGRVATQVAMHYSDVFKGGVFIVGCNYWESTKIPSRPSSHWPPGMLKPRSKLLALAKYEGRYVFLTGDKDFNCEETKAYFVYTGSGYGTCQSACRLV